MPGMEGLTRAILETLLAPARWVAGVIRLPESLPAVELAIGLAWLVACCGLALLALHYWLSSRRAVGLAGCLVAVGAGVIGLFATIVVSFAWLYTLILTIGAADFFGRLVFKAERTRPLRMAATVWCVSALILAGGIPTYHILSGWNRERDAKASAAQRLSAEYQHLITTEQQRVTTAVQRLSTSDEWKSIELTVDNRQQVVPLLHRMAVQENLPYLVVVTPGDTVLARTQPSTAWGDRWPVNLKGIHEGAVDGIVASEQHLPLVASARPIIGEKGSGYILVGAQPVNQNYLVSRLVGTEGSGLFVASTRGVSLTATGDGALLNVMSLSDLEKRLSDDTVATSFSLSANGKRYWVHTTSLLSGSVHTPLMLGMVTAATPPTNPGPSSFEYILLGAVVLGLILLPRILWRKKKKE
jgi:hypothetical protein